MEHLKTQIDTILAEKAQLTDVHAEEVRDAILETLLSSMEVQWGVLYPHFLPSGKVELNRSEDSARWNAQTKDGAVVVQRLIGGWVPADATETDSSSRYEWGYQDEEKRFRYSAYGKGEAQKKVDSNPDVYKLARRRPGHDWSIVE